MATFSPFDSLPPLLYNFISPPPQPNFPIWCFPFPIANPRLDWHAHRGRHLDGCLFTSADIVCSLPSLIAVSLLCSALIKG